MNNWPVLQRNGIDFSEWLTSAKELGAVAYIDKEEDWTSFDCVAKLRGITRVKKVGHAGTLDPLATGLLILCFGKATKSIDEFQAGTKQYDVVVKLGATTETDDRGSAEIVTENFVQPTDVQVTKSLQNFVGHIEQYPPAYSAIRHQGKRQYDLARQGKEFEPRLRQVVVNAIDHISYTWPLISCSINCGKGTYIRSIARDVGAKLGCGGYVQTLRRTLIGDVDVSSAFTISEVQQLLLNSEASV